MKEFLDQINELKLIYPEHEQELDNIENMCLTDIEDGMAKEKAILYARGFIKALITEEE